MLIDNIEKIMKAKGISAYKLEKDTGIKQTTFQGWKRGSQPAADKIETLIQYLKVSADEIFGIEKKETELTPEEQELLNCFRRLPMPEQMRELGRLEAKAEQYQDIENLSGSKIG